MQGKLVLITGGSSGIGKAAAKLLVEHGAKVILQARNIEKLTSVAKEIDPSGNEVSFYSTDLVDAQSVENSARKIIENEGLPDIVINSAGEGEWLSFKESTLSHYADTIKSPYLATALTCKVFYDLMQDRGHGHFITINSAACFFSFPGATGYTPARWAMLGFSKALQADFHGSGFKLSMIAFGKVDTPYFNNNPISESKIPKISDWLVPTLSDTEAAHVIVETVKSQKKIVVRPVILSVLVGLNRFFPNLFDWLMVKTGFKDIH